MLNIAVGAVAWLVIGLVIYSMFRVVQEEDPPWWVMAIGCTSYLLLLLILAFVLGNMILGLGGSLF